MIVIGSLRVVAVTSLLVWHLWMISQRITTYQFLNEMGVRKVLTQKYKDGLISLEEYNSLKKGITR
jgi:predicted transcriptional regulator